MPLALTSNFPTVGNDKVFDYLTAMNANPRVAWVPPGPDVNGRHFRIARKEFAKHGISRLHAVHLDDLAHAGNLRSAFDFVYLTGGSPIVFREHALRTGLSERLRDFLDQGGLVIGASGGAMLLTQNIALFSLAEGTFADVVANRGGLKGLGFVDYELLPHANRFDVTCMEQLRGYARSERCDVVAVNDGAAIVHETSTDYRCIGVVARYRGTEVGT